MVKKVSSWKNKNELSLDEEMAHINQALAELRGEEEIPDKPFILPRFIHKTTDEKVLDEIINKEIPEIPKPLISLKPKKTHNLKEKVQKIKVLLPEFKLHKSQNLNKQPEGPLPLKSLSIKSLPVLSKPEIKTKKEIKIVHEFPQPTIVIKPKKTHNLKEKVQKIKVLLPEFKLHKSQNLNKQPEGPLPLKSLSIKSLPILSKPEIKTKIKKEVKIIKKIKDIPTPPVINKPKISYKLINKFHEMKGLLARFKPHKHPKNSQLILTKPASKTDVNSLKNELNEVATELQSYLEKLNLN